MSKTDPDPGDPFQLEGFTPAEEPIHTTLEIADDRLLDLTDDQVTRIERVTKALTEYEHAATAREQAAAERANAVQSEESARARRVFLERIGEKYLPYAGFLVFGFTSLVVGVTGPPIHGYPALGRQRPTPAGLADIDGAPGSCRLGTDSTVSLKLIISLYRTVSLHGL